MKLDQICIDLERWSFIFLAHIKVKDSSSNARSDFTHSPSLGKSCLLNGHKSAGEKIGVNDYVQIIESFVEIAKDE